MAKYVLGLKLSNCKKMAMHTSTPKRGYMSDFFLNLHF